MSEKEKMLSGKLHNPIDKDLVEERIKCKLLCQKYNSIVYNDIGNRIELLKKILGKTGNKFFVEQPFFCDYGYNIEIGENFYSNHNLVILDSAPVTFGDNVLVGPNCGFYTPEHPIDCNLRSQGVEFAKPIKIGNNVWIGGGVTVLSGVTIGNNVVVAAGAVVKHDVPDNCIIAGVPAKKIKNI